MPKPPSPSNLGDTGQIARFWQLSRRKLTLPLTSRLVHDVDLSTLAALTWCFGAAALSGVLIERTGVATTIGIFLAWKVGLCLLATLNARIRAARPIG